MYVFINIYICTFLDSCHTFFILKIMNIWILRNIWNLTPSHLMNSNSNNDFCYIDIEIIWNFRIFAKKNLYIYFFSVLRLTPSHLMTPLGSPLHKPHNASGQALSILKRILENWDRGIRQELDTHSFWKCETNINLERWYA